MRPPRLHRTATSLIIRSRENKTENALRIRTLLTYVYYAIMIYGTTAAENVLGLAARWKVENGKRKVAMVFVCNLSGVQVWAELSGTDALGNKIGCAGIGGLGRYLPTCLPAPLVCTKQYVPLLLLLPSARQNTIPTTFRCTALSPRPLCHPRRWHLQFLADYLARGLHRRRLTSAPRIVAFQSIRVWQRDR